MEDGDDKKAAELTPAERNRALAALETTGRALASGGGWLGRHILAGGAFLGRRIAAAYRAIDPDVHRHLAQLPLLSYSLFCKRHEEIEPGEPDGFPPLVLVHGLGGNRGTFLLLGWYLWLVGRKRSYRIAFEPGQSIEEQAEALAAFVRDVLAATGEAQVEMVGHSLGGLVARLAVQEHGLAERVRTLVTMGAPHRGTYPARYANTAQIRALRPDSPLIRRLAGRPFPASVRAVCLWSQNDLFVLPPESAVLEGAEAVDMTPFTHYSYLLDPDGWNAVRRALEGGRA